MWSLFVYTQVVSTELREVYVCKAFTVLSQHILSLIQGRMQFYALSQTLLILDLIVTQTL